VNFGAARETHRYAASIHSLRGEVAELSGKMAARVWMCTFNAGPERQIRQHLLPLPDRPLTIGAQHGMYQDWPHFEAFTDCFDLATSSL
jgi:hypothetical protein